MGKALLRLCLAILLCVIAPYFAIHYIIDNLELTWWNIFMVSGIESLWVFLSVDMSRWVKGAWNER